MLNPKVSPLVFPRLLLTGAAGQLGRELRPRLKAYCDVLRVSDQNDLGMAAVGEEIQTADLANASDMQTLLKDVNAVVHLGGVSTEQPWAPILASNIVGMVNFMKRHACKAPSASYLQAPTTSQAFTDKTKWSTPKCQLSLMVFTACPRPLAKISRNCIGRVGALRL